MSLVQNNIKAIKSIFPPSMYEKYGVTITKVPQKKIKLSNNDNVKLSSSKIGTYQLKSSFIKQENEHSSESCRSHITPITSLGVPTTEFKKEDLLISKNLGNNTKLSVKGKMSKGRIYKQADVGKRKLSNDHGALDFSSKPFQIHKNNFVPVLGKTTPENSQLEVVKARNIKSGNPQSRKNLNRRRNLSEDRAKRNIKSKSHSKKRMNSTKNNKPNLVADCAKSKNIAKIEGSFKDGVTSTSTTSNFAKGTNVSEYSDKVPISGNNKRVLQMLNNKIKANNESQCSNAASTKESNKLPQIGKSSKINEGKNLFRKRKQNEQNLGSKNEDVKKFVNSFSASNKSNKSDSNNSKKNLISDEASANNTDEGVRSSKIEESNSNPYQLPVDCEDENSTNQHKRQKLMQTNVLTECKNQNTISKIIKEKQIEAIKLENPQSSKIEIVVKNQQISDKKENIIPNKIDDSDQEKVELKETVIKQSDIISSNPSEENKGLKIKQRQKTHIDSISEQKKEQIPEENIESKEEINNLKRKSSHKIQEVLNQSSPLLNKEERSEAADYGYSLDSKKVTETIGNLDIEHICKCIAHALLKHIEFSKGELLIDDLVEEDEDIPQFSYEFDETLRIDLEELQRQKEMKEWEAETKNIENFERLQYLMQGGDPYTYEYHMQNGYSYNPEFIYEDDIPDENDRINIDQIPNSNYSNYSGIPPLPNSSQLQGKCDITCQTQPAGSINILTNQYINRSNDDINMVNRSQSQTCNMPVFQMDEMLQDNNNYSKGGNRKILNAYYANFSMMGQMKPFFFPPPDLGMIESMGSFENSSRFKSAKSSNMNHSIGNRNHSGVVCTLRSGSRSNEINSEIEVPLQKVQSSVEEVQHHNESSNGQIISRVDKELDNISIGSLDSVDSNFTNAENQHKTISDEQVDKEFNDNKCNKEMVDKEINPNDLSVESYYILEDLSKEGLQKYLKDSMLIFNEKYSVDKQEIEEDVEVMEPTVDLLFRYCKYVIINSKMEKEVPLIALVYLERLLTRTGILMNNMNWRRLILITMIIASKLWDDDSLENEHFPKVMKDVTVKEINSFERVFLDLIGYDLTVKGSEYAKYYFILLTISKAHNITQPFPPLHISKIIQIQNEPLHSQDFITNLEHSTVIRNLQTLKIKLQNKNINNYYCL